MSDLTSGNTVKDVQNKTSKPVSILNFGAKGDGITDNRIAIQVALASGAESILIPKGTFIVSLDPTLSTPEGGKGIAINVPSGKTIYIEGKVMLKAGTVGGSSAIVGNTEPVKNVRIIGLGGTIDGNRDNVKGQVACVCLWNATNCLYEKLHVINGSFLGLSFRGTVPGYGQNKMVSCRIDNMAYIGIQVAKPSLGFIADHCQVTNCEDNGIDIEGNNPAGDPGFGRDIFLKYCTIRNVSNGVFIESVGGVTLTNSTIDGAYSNSVYINRINSGSFNNTITNNKFLNTPDGTGVNFNSYVGETYVSNNYFENFKQSINLNGGATKVVIGVNKHFKISRYLINIAPIINSAVKCSVSQQLLLDEQKNGFPETTPPIYNAANNLDRTYLTSVKPAYSMKSRRLLSGTFVRKKTNTVKNTNWNAYSTYYNGKTIQYFPLDPPIVGEYVKINNITFFVAERIAAGEYVLQKPKNKNGDFTKVTNYELEVNIYRAAWMEQ